MIETRHLQKQYGRQRVLRDVSLTAVTGKLTVLVGHNGCGKTTLMKCLLGLVNADAGQILFNGRESRGAAHRMAVGYMPQSPRYPDNISGREWMRLIESVRGFAPVDATELIEQFGLGEELAKPLAALSGGTSQKLGAVVALMYRPDFLLLDEPTAGLDPVSRIVFKDLVAAARDRGCTILLTSHVISEVDDLADNLIWMDDGRIRYSGDARDVRQITGERQLERALARLMLATSTSPEGIAP